MRYSLCCWFISVNAFRFQTTSDTSRNLSGRSRLDERLLVSTQLLPWTGNIQFIQILQSTHTLTYNFEGMPCVMTTVIRWSYSFQQIVLFLLDSLPRIQLYRHVDEETARRSFRMSTQCGRCVPILLLLASDQYLLLESSPMNVALADYRPSARIFYAHREATSPYGL